LLGLPVLVACGSSPVAPQSAALPPASATPPPPPEPLCKILQPQFDRLTERFNLGGKLECEEVPGVVTLGQFGSNSSLDRSLVACVDDNAQLARAITSEPAAVSGIEYATDAQSSVGGVIGLGRIAPWLPDVRASRSGEQQLRMKLTIQDATWETIPALAKVFEGQNHAYDCLPALCQDNAQVAYKVLRGNVRVELSTMKANGFAGGVELLGSTAGFSLDQATKTANTVSLGSNERLVLAVVAKPPRAELADASQCDGCGARGQPCCGERSTCDDQLSCVESTCRPRGYPGAPCDDEGRCGQGAVCVQGVCRTGCGAAGLSCCDKTACRDGLRCHSGQRARRDVSVFDQTVERSGGLFGTDVDLELGSAACGDGRLRSRFATMKVEGDSANCDRTQWMEANDPNDCRMRVHLHVSPFSDVRCRVQIFATEVDPAVPAPQALCK
jgi:hypothetical protein